MKSPAIRMIEDVLVYSRAATHGNSFSLADLNYTVSQAIKNLEKCIEESSAVIVHEQFPVLPEDKIQIIPLFQNLIENVINFRNKAKPEIQNKV